MVKRKQNVQKSKLVLQVEIDMAKKSYAFFLKTFWGHCYLKGSRRFL